ncbi:DUF6176 family protein [Lacisediminihabitans profunda]|uniref:Uncharacterized protein n=1 Tax=Lacisediminihabitans profunda TaxID=2594790 RepID=A0A5C8UJ00_9MICO|nr:DUF6176 family protein [Lacisediminihabitans profunda]TXN28136.1 hypothetical protein FVP33_18515 [Lacisediminihabitans profunda]
MTDEKPFLPFRPTAPDFPGYAMPPTVPDGLRLELSRARIREGQVDEFEEWMRMLNDRYDESLLALPAERAVFEATFRHTEADGSTWIYHLSLMGEGGGGLDESNQIDADHAAFSRRVKEPGWEELEPKFMLTPAHLLEAMTSWGLTGRP